MRTLLAIAGIIGFACAAFSAESRIDAATRAESLAAGGHFAEAAKAWAEVVARFAKAKDAGGEFRARLSQAAAEHALGNVKMALITLRDAEPLAENDALRGAQLKAARGAVVLFSREAATAEPLLRDALKLARKAKDGALAATIQNNLGLLLSAEDETTDEARRMFSEAAKSLLSARRNLAELELATGRFAEAGAAIARLAKDAAALPDGYEKAFLLMAAGQLGERLFTEAPAHDNALRLRALALYQQAEKIATALGHRRALSYAYGYQGALYEFEKRHEEALALTHRAIAAAQQAQSADSLYRWEWQAGRLLAKLGARDAAIEALRRGIATLQTIRNDVAIRHGNRNSRSSFREVTGGLFVELSDQLLQRALTLGDDDAAQQTAFREARDTAELLKAAELEDYFQDDCVNVLKSRTKKIENLSPTAAVLYIIPLAERTEILVSLPSGRIERFRAEPGDDALTETVRQFRLNIEDRTTNGYLDQAQQLYKWLIAPVIPLLDAGKFDTLVFVPDGALRTVPMSALHDGEKFLVERYAIAVTPGLELMEVKKSSQAMTRMLVSGLSDSVQGFSALPGVTPELETVAKLYDVKDTLKDRAFSKAAVSKRIEEGNYSIVHIASHGVFNRDVRKSFVLTHDNQLTLDNLESLIRPAQLRDKPLELLVLSACQTAAGDDRAALGLAGIAVKAGARSAFATLWFVNDKASSQLVKDFYGQLRNRPERNKAQALQMAQMQLIKDPVFEHPCYWAPYLIIGNWL